MVRSQEQKTRDTDKRIQRKFGITLADRERRIREQDGKCKICGGPLDAYGPSNLDHFHFRVRAFQETDPHLLAIRAKWRGEAYDEIGKPITILYAKTKAAACAAVKKQTMPWSIRGLLCFKCNRCLGYIENFLGAAHKPEILLSVFKYLKNRLTQQPE